MSATRQIIITCDGDGPTCLGNDWSADVCHLTAAEQRKKASQDRDWRHVRGKDYCPNCFEFFRNSGVKP